MTDPEPENTLYDPTNRCETCGTWLVDGNLGRIRECPICPKEGEEST